MTLEHIFWKAKTTVKQMLKRNKITAKHIPYIKRFIKYCEEMKNVYIHHKKIHIPYLVVSVGQACTLRCAHCGNLTPYAPKECRSYSYVNICQDINRLLEVAQIDCIQIQGGEPFSYSFLDKLLEGLPPDQEIIIATNGTLIPIENVMLLLKERKVTVRISDYGLPQYVETVNKLIYKLTQNSVPYLLYQFVLNNGTWIDFGGIEVKYPEKSKRIIADRYWNCGFRDCLTLENSIIGYCSRSTIAPKIQGYEYKEKDYLMLKRFKDKTALRWKLLNYTYRKHPMNCCRYCYGMEGKVVKPAIQIESLK